MFNKIRFFSVKLLTPELPMGLFYTGLAMGLGLGIGADRAIKFLEGSFRDKKPARYTDMIESKKVESSGLVPSER
jgi:hypothetical protein